MSVSAYRITRTARAATAFDGEGARLFGGRWNSPGTRIVYVAGSRSLATLEVLVHIEDASTIEKEYCVIPLVIPEGLISRVDRGMLPADWNSPEPLPETQYFGDAWVRSGSSAVLEVPSAVTNEEHNYLINPAHPDFPAIVIGPASPFRIDSRLA